MHESQTSIYNFQKVEQVEPVYNEAPGGWHEERTKPEEY
jgi:hypothetical protein